MFSLESKDQSVILADGDERLRVSFVTPAIARITCTRGKPFLTRPSLIVTSTDRFTAYELSETADAFLISTPKLSIEVSKATGAMRYLDATGKLLLAEKRDLAPKAITRNIFRKDAAIAGGQSIDGARAAAGDFETVFDRDAFEATLEFVFAEDEALFGLGSHEEGHGNLRGNRANSINRT
jgi:alpha-D-xyloside xylohydrolase